MSVINGTLAQTGSPRWDGSSSMNVDPVDDYTLLVHECLRGHEGHRFMRYPHKAGSGFRLVRTLDKHRECVYRSVVFCHPELSTGGTVAINIGTLAEMRLT